MKSKKLKFLMKVRADQRMEGPSPNAAWKAIII